MIQERRLFWSKIKLKGRPLLVEPEQNTLSQ